MSRPYVMIFAKDCGVDMPDVDVVVLREACRALNYGISNEPCRLVNARGETSKVTAQWKLRQEIDKILAQHTS